MIEYAYDTPFVDALIWNIELNFVMDLENPLEPYILFFIHDDDVIKANQYCF